MNVESYVVSVAARKEHAKRDQLAGLINGMHPQTAIEMIEGALGLGRFLYHPTLTVFMPWAETPRGQAMAVGQWLIANRPAVQEWFAVENWEGGEDVKQAA